MKTTAAIVTRVARKAGRVAAQCGLRVPPRPDALPSEFGALWDETVTAAYRRAFLIAPRRPR